MLYVSTRNAAATYTAHRAIHEPRTPDGGLFVPFHLPVFSAEELQDIKQKSCSNTIARVLNLLFAKKITGSDVEFAIGKTPLKLEYMQHKLIFAETWHNTDGSEDYLLKNLYTLISDRKYVDTLPIGWAKVGIRIALLFGIYSELDCEDTFDLAITADDYALLTAVLYSREMGLPVNMTVCTGNEDSVLWDLLNRDECAAGNHTSDYLECVLFLCFGAEDAQPCGRFYYINDEQRASLQAKLFAAVVSVSRVDSVISSVQRSVQYAIDKDSALAYGGLQDYRSATGVSRETLILMKQRPVRVKE